MKSIKIISFIALAIVCISITSCKKTGGEDPVSQTISLSESYKRIISATVSSTATGLAATFTNLIADSVARVTFCRTFTDSIRYFSDLSGYFFIEDFRGWNIAYPTNHSLEGTFLWDLTDPFGTYFIRVMSDSAQTRGHGFIEYYWNNPATGSVGKKLSFVSAIPGIEYFIGSGFYIPATDPSISILESNKEISENLALSTALGFGSTFKTIYTDSVAQVQFSRNYIDSIRFYVDRSGYFFIVNFSGFCMANAANKSFEGTSVYDLQDSKGFYFIREMILLAKDPGNGFVEYYWKNPASGQDTKKITYIHRIKGTDYFIGAGVYIE